MKTLSTELRNKLERKIVEARDFAEVGARSALEALAVHHSEPYRHMSVEERRLRNHLRARARQLGDKQDKYGNLEINRLVQECAYEHWHRMLFARFLAENGLLIEPESGVAISLDECAELAKEEESDLWSLASLFAQQMLPQIFRPDDPTLQIYFAHEHQLKLEKLLNDLEPETFMAGDSLGWVYQFWQSKRKKEVNDSGKKIGAEELPAVTQLFTEPYMVNFLIHNTLGAWHAGIVLAANPELAEEAQFEEELRKAVSVPGVSWDYLRFIRTDDGKGPWRPAAGVFAGWPRKAAELKILDPCCGSGHFQVTVFNHLVPVRMAEEGLTVGDACEAVLRENLHGLEIDERCTQIAAFTLALSAWTYPGAGGYRPLPELRIACSGIAPNARKKDWLDLAGKDERLRNGMARLYDLFKDASTLGSLIDPRSALENNLITAEFDELRPLLKKVMSTEKDNYKQHELGVAASGIVDALRILGERYHLIITNVPYLARGKQTQLLSDYCRINFTEAKADLATVFVWRLLNLCCLNGTIAIVTPQNLLFSSAYTKFRKLLLQKFQLDISIRLGEHAFSSSQAAGAFPSLIIITNKLPNHKSKILALDASIKHTPAKKAAEIQYSELESLLQNVQLQNPSYRIHRGGGQYKERLSDYVTYHNGICTGDYSRFGRCFWELSFICNGWELQHSTVKATVTYGGMEHVLWWENGKGDLYNSVCKRLGEGQVKAWLRGAEAWSKNGIIISAMRSLPVSLYTGELFDDNSVVLIPKSPHDLPAIWAFCSSIEYHEEVRRIDQALKVRGPLVEVPFNFKQWQVKACQLPEISSNDPTQWVFHGHPAVSTSPLQVAVARLLGYRWPAELNDSMRLSTEARELARQCGELDNHTDNDGIICVPSVRGEDPAADRLRALLVSAYGDDWSQSKEQELIAVTGSNARDLDEWLRSDFFEQHCKLFHHRPFIWHIWDGRKRDGFHALVNYHKLAEGGGKGRKLLENLTYSYLGDWITRQKDGVKRGEGGAEDRLAAAVELQKRLVAILEGEPPFDIFVRWKPVEKQPIGWDPDINDGVRVNIRPFMSSDIPDGKRGAGMLRWKPNIKWSKDKGNEPKRPLKQFPWFWLKGEFTGDRFNDVHLTNDEKRKAREDTARKSGGK